MSSNESSRRGQFFGYPTCRQGPDTSPYIVPPDGNPVLRGLPLAIAGSIASKLNIIPSLLWSNTGFGTLRLIKELDDYEPRYDPTVIRTSRAAQSNTLDVQVPTERNFPFEESSDSHYTAQYYTSAYKTGRFTPTTVAAGLKDQIPGNEQYRAVFFQIRWDEVLAAAEASTERYKAGKPLSALDGVPVTVKDEVDLDGYKKCLGSSIDFTRKRGGTSWCIKKWKEAGAIIIGKSNMHELGLDTTNNNPVRGTPRNPYNSNYYTGGSSGGSAYAVSSGLIPVAHGVDGGGSIRLPAAYCGVYGLKPTHGRVSILPTPSIPFSTGVMGPLASCITDIEMAYRILATPDPSNPVSSLFAPPSASVAVAWGQKKVIGVCRPWFACAEKPILAACNAAIEYYTSLGYETIDIDIPYLHEGQLAHAMTILAESSAGVPLHQIPHLSAANKILLSVGRQTPGADLLLAQKLRNLLMQHLAYLFHEHPGLLIVTPTTPNVGWRISGGEGDLKYGVSDANMSLKSMRYVWLANFTGCPALNIPVGMVDVEAGEGEIPIGMMAMAEWCDEEGLLRFGREGEKWLQREKKVPKAKTWVDAKQWTERGGNKTTGH